MTADPPVRLISHKYRFRPGSGSRFRSRPGLELEIEVNAPHPRKVLDTDNDSMETSISSGEGQGEALGNVDQSQVESDGARNLLLRSSSPKIGNLGYFVEEDFRRHRRNHTCERVKDKAAQQERGHGMNALSVCTSYVITLLTVSL